MSDQPQEISVQVTERDKVTALLYSAGRKRAGVTLILGHGAGANQMSGFMRLFASGLAARGLDAMTFNFVYSELGRTGPDPRAKLESCYLAVMAAASRHRKLKNNRLAIGGKSMGGRIASQVAAADGPGIVGLVFLGYPLHPPGKPDQLRDKHLKDVRAPMLFVQGSRDAFGTPSEIAAIIKRDKLRATLYAIEGGDHSLKVLKSSPLTQEQVYEAVMDEIVGWLPGT